MAKYRQNAGAILRRRDGLILMCRSVDGGDYPWQFPQGGVQAGESLEEAMWREVSEELGIERPRELCRLVGCGPPVRYAWCKPWGEFVGQEQSLFLLDYRGTNDDICLEQEPSAEFNDLRWVTLDESIELIVPAKRIVLEQTYAELGDAVPS